MSFRKGAFVLLAVMVIAAVLVPVPSEGATVYEMDCDDVQFVVMTDGIEMSTAEGYPISIHLYNGNASTVTVRLADDGSSKVKLSLSEDQYIIKPGKSELVSASLVTDRYTPMGSYDITFVMSILNGTDAQKDVTMTVPLSVTSNYSSGENFNRFFGIFDNDLQSPFNTAPVTALLTFLAWIAIAIVVSSLVLVILKKLFRITEKKSDTLGRSTVIGVFVCVVLTGVSNCILILGLSEQMVNEIGLVTGVLYILSIALVIWDIYKALVTNSLTRLEKRGVGGMDTSLIPLFKAIGKIIIVIMCIAIILSLFEVNFVTLITSAGLAGLGLSFGIKPAINELFSGITVLVTRPFKIGDYVTIGSDDRLRVVSIGILRTNFKTGYTMEAASMPNSKIVSSKIVNISHKTVKYRSTISIKVPFDANLTLIKKIVKRVATEHPMVVTDGSVAKPNAVFSACNDGSAVVVTLSFYVNDFDVNATTCAQIREGILKEFHERGITIPLNRMEVTLYKGGGTNA